MEKNIIGRKLDGRYEIREIIGVGGMAIVYKAYDCIDDRIVAIKILKDEFLTNDEFRRRFKNESKAIAVLSHPNIVKVYDVSFSEKLQYIVMEYIDGITLKEYIDKQKVLTWKEAVHFTEQILRALEHAHEKGIVHRDIKPQNIMMLKDGSIKVTDFGIARFADSETRTMTDKAIGSVHYISPEQARGEATDDKSDIYSVGVMLFEMLTGQLPFEADSAVSVAIMQMQNEPRHPREINPDIPEGLEDIVLRAMQKEPANRYQSAAEMLSDIEQFKLNPSIHFQYKYFVDEDPTKYVEAINDIKNEDEEPKKKKKNSMLPVLSGIAAAALLFIVAVVLGVLWLTGVIGGNGSQVKCPNFVGQKYTDVIANSAYKSFKITIKTTAFSDKYAAGVIMGQDITPGFGIKKNATIPVTVSKGPETGKVPNVVNMEKTAAINQLANYGFKNYTIVQVYDDNISIGFVVSTDPVQGANVPLSSKVIIDVSKGKAPQLISVPNVVGDTLDVAKNKLQGVLLSVTLTPVASDKPANTVLSQTPTAGTTVLANTPVNLTYSTGPAASSSQQSASSQQTSTDVMITLTNLPQVSNPNNPYTINVYVNGREYTDSNELNNIYDVPFTTIGNSTTFAIKGGNFSGVQDVVLYISGGDNSTYSTKYATYSVNFDTGKILSSQVDSSIFSSNSKPTKQ